MSSNRIEITDKTIIKSILWILLFVAFFYFKSIVLVLFFSIILASIISRFSLLLQKIKIPRPISVILFYLFFLSFIFLISYIFLPSAIRYLGTIINSLPDLLNSFKNFNLNSSAWYSNFLSYLTEYVRSIDVNLLSQKIKSWIFDTSIKNSSTVFNTVIYIFVTFIIAFYLSLKEKGLQNFLKLLSPRKYEDYIVSLFERVEKKISSWFLGQVLVAFMVGIAIYLVLILFKIPFAFPIALLAFVFELLPMLGVTLSAIPAIFFAWNIGGITLSLLILVAFFLVSQFASYFLYPKVVGKFVNMPTVVIIIALFIGAEIGGFWGALVCIPIATIAMEILSDFEKSKQKEIEALK